MTGMTVRALEWLESRALDVEVCDRLGLASRGGGGEEVLIYPFVREGKTVGRKHRPLTVKPGQPRFWWNDGDTHCCYNEDCLRDDSLIVHDLVITEGQDDCIAAIQAGHFRTISVPDGAPGKPIEDIHTSAKYAWIDDIRKLIGVDRVKTVILATDGDDAGAALMHDLSVRFGRARCKYVVYPKAKDPQARGRERLKDLNEVLEDYGERGVREVIARAQWMRVDGVYRMSDLPPLPENTIYEIAGMPAFTEHFRMRLGDLSVWTGVPSHGKSSVLNDLVCRIVHRYGVRAGWASFEQEPQRDHRRALRSWFCEDYEPKLTRQQRKDADAWIDDHHRFLIPNEDQDATLEWLIEKMEAAVVQHDCRILILDPWNEATHHRDNGETETDYTNRSLRTLKKFAKVFGVHLAVVAHPTKMRRNEDGTYPIPSLYDCAGSAAWFNKPDQGVIIHRLTSEETIFKVQKSRYADILGVPGIVAFHYSKQTRRYIEVERGLSDEQPKPRRSRARASDS